MSSSSSPATVSTSCVAVLGDALGHVRRDVAGREHRSQGGVIPPDLLHADQVDDALEVLAHAQRELQDQGVGVQLGAHHRHGAVEVGPDAVHLVQEGDLGDVVFVGLAPHGLGLGFDPFHRAENTHRTVQDPQGPLDFDGEIDVAGRVDEMDLDVLPGAGGHRRGDGDAAFLLVRHPVHDGLPVVHLSQFVGAAGIKQDALRHGGLAGVDVRDDADVADGGDLGLFHRGGQSVSIFKSRATPDHGLGASVGLTAG